MSGVAQINASRAILVSVHRRLYDYADNRPTDLTSQLDLFAVPYKGTVSQAANWDRNSSTLSTDERKTLFMHKKGTAQGATAATAATSKAQHIRAQAASVPHFGPQSQITMQPGSASPPCHQWAS